MGTLFPGGLKLRLLIKVSSSRVIGRMLGYGQHVRDYSAAHNLR